MKLALPRGIGPRLFLSFGLLVGLLLLVAAVCLVRLASLNREFSTIVVDRHSRTEVLKEVTDAQQRMMRLVNHLLVVDAKPQIDADLARIEDAKRSIGERLEQLDKASEADDARGKALQREAQERNGAYLVNLVRFTRQIAAGQRAEARALLADQLEAQMDASLDAMTNLSHAQTALMHRAQQEAQDSYETAQLYVWAISIAAALLSIVVATVIARGITRPLGAAARLADSVAAGDLTGRVAAHGNDETARLMQALARMTASLTRIVSGVRAGSDNIAGTTGELLTGNAQLTQRAEEQASSLEETAATLEELTTTVRRNAEHAGEAKRLAASASEVATRAGETVDRAVQRMGSITTASRKIAEITHVINAIAFQTNILALNAAVEAARAGEQGRGFAVVAAEVRSLAQRSANAAKEIGELIATTVGEVEGGAKLVNEAGRTMGEVVEGIGAVAEHVRDISDASRDQSEAIEQVNKALAEIDQVTQHNAALAEETAAAIASLEHQARALVESVGVFQLAEDSAPAPAPRAPVAPEARLQKQTARSPAPLPRLRPLAVTKAAR